MPTYDDILKSVYRYLGFRPRTQKELTQFLKGKHTTDDTTEKILSHLSERNLVNDLEFAEWWIEQRSRFRQKGERVIRMELKQKGVAENIIDSAFKKTSFSQKDQVKELIAKNFHKYEDLPKRELYQKLGAFLQRRGFDWETIRRSIDDYLADKV